MKTIDLPVTIRSASALCSTPARAEFAEILATSRTQIWRKCLRWELPVS